MTCIAAVTREQVRELEQHKSPAAISMTSGKGCSTSNATWQNNKTELLLEEGREELSNRWFSFLEDIQNAVKILLVYDYNGEEKRKQISNEGKSLCSSNN